MFHATYYCSRIAFEDPNALSDFDRILVCFSVPMSRQCPHDVPVADRWASRDQSIYPKRRCLAIEAASGIDPVKAKQAAYDQILRDSKRKTTIHLNQENK